MSYPTRLGKVNILEIKPIRITVVMRIKMIMTVSHIKYHVEVGQMYGSIP